MKQTDKTSDGGASSVPSGAEESLVPSHVGRYELRATGDEARSYDFARERPPQKTTTVIESIGHLVKGCLGAGVVSINESYMKCGIWTALILNVFLAFFVTYCVYILIKSSQRMYGRIKEPKLSYPDLAEASLATGPFPKLRNYDKCFRYAVDFIICFDLFGSCCVYQVIIAKQLKQLYLNTSEINDDNIRLYIACLLVPCALICLITTLKYLAPFSLVADAFIVITALSTVKYALEDPVAIDSLPAFKTMTGLFEFCGVCVFSMEGVGVSMAIENTMTEPTKFPIVLIGGQLIVASIVMIIGFFGYWGFGELSRAPVTLNFPLTAFSIMLKVMLSLMIYVTFALNFWVPFDLVWYYLKNRHPQDKHWLWCRIYRTLHVISITLIAIAFPNIGNLMGLLGSFCLSNMGFIFPAFIELSLNWTDPGLGKFKWRLWKAVIIILAGFVLCVAGTFTNVIGLYNTLTGGKS